MLEVNRTSFFSPHQRVKLLASAHETSDIKSFAEIVILSSESKAFSHNGIKREKDDRSKELICHRVSHYLYRSQLEKIIMWHGSCSIQRSVNAFQSLI